MAKKIYQTEEERRKAKTKAKRKYNDSVYETITVFVKKGQKQSVSLFASDHGLSVSRFINELLNEHINKNGGAFELLEMKRKN